MRCWTEWELTLLASHARTRAGIGEGRLPDAVQVADAPVELLERRLGGLAIALGIDPPRLRILRAFCVACHRSGLMPAAGDRYEPAGFRRDRKLTPAEIGVYGAPARATSSGRPCAMAGRTRPRSPAPARDRVLAPSSLRIPYALQAWHRSYSDSARRPVEHLSAGSIPYRSERNLRAAEPLGT